jgi:hypothetical protein
MGPLVAAPDGLVTKVTLVDVGEGIVRVVRKGHFAIDNIFWHKLGELGCALRVHPVPAAADEIEALHSIDFVAYDSIHY